MYEQMHEQRGKELKLERYRKAWKYGAILAVSLLLLALCAGALTWVITGSRGQALEATAVFFISALMVILLVFVIASVVSLAEL